MAKLIKSHSNFVIKEKHSETNKGTIFERDITTIGGIGDYPSSSQMPIYNSGNFLITVNKSSNGKKNYDDNGWVKPENNTNEFWKSDNVNKEVMTNNNNSVNIVLKRDYQSLRDFAYFGSCVELIRASITDILDKYPGELHVPIAKIAVMYRLGDNYERLGGELVLVDNPFNIDIHTRHVGSNVKNRLRYLCDGGYNNYQIIKDGEIIDITSVNVNINTEDKRNEIGEKYATVIISGEQNKKVNIHVYNDDKCNFVYLTEVENCGLSIRPKNKFLEEFYNSLDNFQSILLTRKTYPIHNPLFEIISEKSFGYVKELKRFKFPFTYGGYNLASTTPDFQNYLESLRKVAEFYDEVFCDNIWRSMTHEAVKNFDWTYTKEFTKGEEIPFIEGGSKIQKLIRSIGREFDEIKSYIDGIKNSKTISYSEKECIPDYMITDNLENDGFDLMNIFTYNIQIANNKNFFSEILNENVKPYSKEYLTKKMLNKKQTFVSCRQYTNEREYTPNDVSNSFMNVLRLNSRNMFKHKGTIEGIEMILGMFGLKSKRWCDKFKNNRVKYDCDYEITEYSCITNAIEDDYIDKLGTTKINWYNSTKTISYNTDDFRNGIYVPYQGLPVRAYYNGNKTRLYPYFSNDMVIDGNPWYQMNGGWLEKVPFTFDRDNNVLKQKEMGDIFEETLNNIKSVKDLQELISIPTLELKSGDIYHVKQLNKEYLIIDGVLYEVYSDKEKKYITVTVNDGTVIIGNTFFYNGLYISGKDGSNQYYNLNSMIDGSKLYIFINEDNQIKAYNDLSTVLNVSYFNPSTNFSGSNMTHYFKIINPSNKTEISNHGWVRIDKTTNEYKKILSLKSYYKGNNPHTSMFKYDKGYEYISYFSRLFKHAYDEKLFDRNCYNSSNYKDGNVLNYNAAMKEIATIGFKNLESDQENTCDSNYNVYNDEKIHFFGNFIDESKKNPHMYGDNDYNLFGHKGKYGCGLNYNTKDDDIITDRIMNTKRVEIKFLLKDKYKDGIKDNNEAVLKIVKYYDSVIMNYLSQFIPSTLIVTIKYDV